MERKERKELLTSAEVIKILGISKNTLSRWIKQGKIGYIQVGVRKLFPRKEIEEFLRKNAVNLHVDVEEIIKDLDENLRSIDVEEKE